MQQIVHLNGLLKYLLCLLTSLAISGVICEWYGDEWEQQVRSDLYRLKQESTPSLSQEFVDSSGIPYVIYSPLNGVNAGKQYNPTIVCNYAITYHQKLNEGSTQYETPLLNCLNWLKQNISYRNDAAFYVFKWKQPWYDSVGVPFTSGMTSGLAIQVFIDGYHLTHDSSYLQSAKSLLRGFYVPINNGGFTYVTNKGWWFEELADTTMHTPFILDGHIFALTGVHHYYAIIKDDSASLVFQKGISYLKHVLPLYDKGEGYAYYDKYRKPADKHYQHVLANQMKLLWQITKDPTFLDYHKKWRTPFSQPYIYRVMKERNISGLTLTVVMALPFLILGFALIRKKFL